MKNTTTHASKSSSLIATINEKVIECFADPKTLQQFNCTDLGNAQLFARLFSDFARYDHTSQEWLLWHQHWWITDKVGQVYRLAEGVVEARKIQALTEDNKKKQKRLDAWANRSESRPKLEALIKLAQVQPEIAEWGDVWDRNPYLLGVANGVVDLKTGMLRPGRPDDRITLHTEIAFDATATCPRWEQFLSEVFDRDDLIEYIHRVIGYCITGDISEQVLFLCYGVGENGKSTFLDVLHHVLGPFYCNVPFSTFEAKNKQSIPNDIAMTKGARIIAALETSESTQLNEARLKLMTGSDPVTARKLFKEFQTFNPTGKIWLAFNHRPEVMDDSDGFWRRVRLIPFLKQFPEQAREKGLLERLKAEAPGIIGWAVRGCLKWQESGLQTPEIVVHASQEYRADSDPLREFFDECIEIDHSYSVVSADLWSAYLQWAENNRVVPLKRPVFSAHLKTKKFSSKTVGHNKTHTWFGLALNRNRLLPEDAGVRVGAGVKPHYYPN